jgi:hypothetical protein
MPFERLPRCLHGLRVPTSRPTTHMHFHRASPDDYETARRARRRALPMLQTDRVPQFREVPPPVSPTLRTVSIRGQRCSDCPVPQAAPDRHDQRARGEVAVADQRSGQPVRAVGGPPSFGSSRPRLTPVTRRPHTPTSRPFLTARSIATPLEVQHRRRPGQHPRSSGSRRGTPRGRPVRERAPPVTSPGRAVSSGRLAGTPGVDGLRVGRKYPVGGSQEGWR